jgi:hypothetical protein
MKRNKSGSMLGILALIAVPLMAPGAWAGEFEDTYQKAIDYALDAKYSESIDLFSW